MFAIKKRATPVALAVSGYVMIKDVSVGDADAMEPIRKLRLGLITVILPKKTVVPDLLTAGSDRVGIRYPDHEITVRLIDLSGTRGSHPQTLTCQESRQRWGLRDQCGWCWTALTVSPMAARCVYGVASTVVDLVEHKVLRKGAGYEQAVRYLW